MEDSKEIIYKWLHLTKDGQSRINALFSMKMNEHFPFTSVDFKGIEASATNIYGIGKALNEYFIEKDYPFKAFAGYDIDTARKLILECEKYIRGKGEYPEIKIEYLLEMFGVEGKSIPNDLQDWLYYLPENGLDCKIGKHSEFVKCSVVSDVPENKEESETRTDDVPSEPAYIKRTGKLYCPSHNKILNKESDFKEHQECFKKTVIFKREQKISLNPFFEESSATTEKQKQKIRDEIKALRDY